MCSNRFVNSAVVWVITLHGLSAVLWHKLMCVVVHMYIAPLCIVEPGSHHVTKPGPPDDDLESVKGLDIHFHRRHFV